MGAIEEKFAKLATDNAPGQEGRQREGAAPAAIGDRLDGTPVDFSHGDVNAFAPTPGSREAFLTGLDVGGAQAYTEYRGKGAIRDLVASHLAAFTGAPISAREELILTPGTQGALFLAVASTVSAGDKVAVVQPDYFANRKLVQFFAGEMVPVRLDYLNAAGNAGLDLSQLESAFKAGARLFVFSNPNNPSGAVYSAGEIQSIARLANSYGATVIVDELYSRLLYAGTTYTHLRAAGVDPDRIITIIGPSKTESLSGYRLGVAFGSARLIERMERLQAIVSLRAGGYSQAVLNTWFAEPAGWLEERIVLHQAIRDALLTLLRGVTGLEVRTPEGGSYLFPRLPALSVEMQAFVRILREQAGVIVTPGAEFGPHSTDSVRLNFSQDHAAAVHAAERTITMIGRYRR